MSFFVIRSEHLLLMQFRMGSHALPGTGLLGQPFPGICAAALCARPEHWEMKGIWCWIAPILPTFAASFGRGTSMLTVSCSVLYGTRTRRLSAIA